MHVLLEGVVTREIRILLHHCIHEGYIMLAALNRQIKEIILDTKKKRIVLHRYLGRPLIEITSWDREILYDFEWLGILSDCLILVYIASQSWCLAVTLPLLIGDVVPETDLHYQCFLTLLTILSISMAHTMHTDDACLLAATIANHHYRFHQLYPGETVTPKMHYMIHFPQQLLK
jgi:hypothetical protein